MGTVTGAKLWLDLTSGHGHTRRQGGFFVLDQQSEVAAQSLFEGDMHLWRWAGPGASAKPLLVFLHANGFNGLTYRSVLAPLAEHFEVIAPDLRGNGLTRLPADPKKLLSFEPFARDVAALLPALRGEPGRPLILAGHSLGGVASLILAAEDRHGIDGLLVAEAPLLPPPVYWFFGAFARFRVPLNVVPLGHRVLKRRRHFADFDDALAAHMGRGIFRTWPEEAVRDFVQGGTKPDPAGGLALACAPEWEAATYNAQGYNFWPRLGGVRCPVHLMGSEKASTMPGPIRKGLLRGLKNAPKATLEELPGTTHSLPLERPAHMRSALVDLLQQVRN